MPFCGSCGNQLSDLALACPKCGTATARGLTTPGAPVLSHEYRSAPTLRPLGVGEVIDAAIKIYTRNAGPLLTLVAIVVVPVQIINALILASAASDSLNNLIRNSQPSQGVPSVNFGDLRRFLVATALTTILGFIAAQLATAASMRTVSEAYLGERPNWQESLQFAVSKLGRLLGFTLLLFLVFVAVGLAGAVLVVISLVLTKGLALILLIPALIVAFAWVSISLSVGVPAILIEDAGIVEAMRRSIALVRGRWWAVFGTLFLSQLIAGVIRFVFAAVFGLLLHFGSGTAVGVFTRNAILGTITGVLTTPFLAAVIAIMYFDLRVRKEGFDIELLAQRIDRPELIPPPPPPSARPGAAAPRRAAPRRPVVAPEEAEAEAPPPPARKRAAPRRPGHVAEEEEAQEPEPGEPPPPRKTAPRKPTARKSVAREPVEIELPDDDDEPEPEPPKPAPRGKPAPRREPPVIELPDDDGPSPEDPEFHHG